jgi:hypothetical protein
MTSDFEAGMHAALERAGQTINQAVADVLAAVSDAIQGRHPHVTGQSYDTPDHPNTPTSTNTTGPVTGLALADMIGRNPAGRHDTAPPAEDVNPEAEREAERAEARTRWPLGETIEDLAAALDGGPSSSGCGHLNRLRHADGTTTCGECDREKLTAGYETGAAMRQAQHDALIAARAEVRRLSALVGEYPTDWIDRWRPADEHEQIGDQIDRLADAIIRLGIGEPAGTEPEGVIDVAIRLLRWAYGTTGVYLIEDGTVGFGREEAERCLEWDRRTRSARPWAP